MTKLFVALALVALGALFYWLQASFLEGAELLFAAAIVWGLSLSLLNSSFLEWKREKPRLPAE